MKVIFFLLLSVTFAYSAIVQPRLMCHRNDAHDLSLNCDAPGDILHKEVVEQGGSLLQTHKKTISYPQQGSSKEPIGCVKVTDLVGNNWGGCPHVISGGTGFNTVTIEIISQIGGDIHATVEIYKAT